jgi:hypothetical protein
VKVGDRVSVRLNNRPIWHRAEVTLVAPPGCEPEGYAEAVLACSGRCVDITPATGNAEASTTPRHSPFACRSCWPVR